MQVARVTAAHEFFHAIQYGYDAGEDPWLMESTATWMEDQFDDSSNDNRQYLPWSQLRNPGTPLDTFTNGGFEQYGNWVFFEYLSERYGRRIVRSVWKHAAAFGRGGHQFSAEAIHSALRSHGGMTTVFGRYASGNTVPRRAYAEGKAYPAAGSASAGDTHAGIAPDALDDVRRAAPGVGEPRGHSGCRPVRPEVAAAAEGGRPPAGRRVPAVVVLVTRKHHPATRMFVHLTKQGRGQRLGAVQPRRHARGHGHAGQRVHHASPATPNGGYSCDGHVEGPAPVVRGEAGRLQALTRRAR